MYSRSRRLVHVGVARGPALGLQPRLLGLLRAPGAQQQVGDQRLRARMLGELTVPTGGDRPAHCVDRLVEAAEFLVGVGELVQVLGAQRLRLGERQHTRNQANARAVVVAPPGHLELPVDRSEVVHVPKATLTARAIVALVLSGIPGS
jgi:hypothetical protein